MEETCKNKKKNGFLLISSLFVLSTMIIIVSFYLSAITQEIKVSQIVNTSAQAYYLAESGIQEAFWKLQNDAAYKNNFEADPSWSATFTRSDSIIPGGSYTVTIANTALAAATITATSTIPVRGAYSQRVVQAGVFKALNDSPAANVAVYQNGAIYSIGSNVQIAGGNLFSNQDIDLKFFSNWTIDGDAKSPRKINISPSSSLSANNILDQDNPPVPLEISMPQIDFDSQDPASFKSRASQVYTSQDFRSLLKNFPVTTLNGITYITGDVDIKKGATLTINGALVADGSINIANGYSGEETGANLFVNKIGNEPSGIFSKRNITIGGFSATADIEGLVYAGGKVRIQDGIFQNVDVSITGGIISQNMEILVSWEPTVITYNQQFVSEALGIPLFSQVLFINHWEEEY